MKKSIKVILICVLALCVAGASFALYSSKSKVEQSQDHASSPKVVNAKACGLLDEASANTILGKDIEQLDLTPTKRTSPSGTDDKSKMSSSCTYSYKNGSTYPTSITVLPLDDDELQDRLNGLKGGGHYVVAEDYGVDTFKHSGEDLGKKYISVVVFYSNAMVTISADQSNEGKIKPLLDKIEQKVQHENK